MTPDGDIRRDLGPDAEHDLLLLAERLLRERPIPGAGFRGELRRRLELGASARPRPRRLHALIRGYATAGTLLLLAGTLSVLGIGPLAA